MFSCNHVWDSAREGGRCVGRRLRLGGDRRLLGGAVSRTVVYFMVEVLPTWFFVSFGAAAAASISWRTHKDGTRALRAWIIALAVMMVFLSLGTVQSARFDARAKAEQAQE